MYSLLPVQTISSVRKKKQEMGQPLRKLSRLLQTKQDQKRLQIRFHEHET